MVHDLIAAAEQKLALASKAVPDVEEDPLELPFATVEPGPAAVEPTPASHIDTAILEAEKVDLNWDTPLTSRPEDEDSILELFDDDLGFPQATAAAVTAARALEAPIFRQAAQPECQEVAPVAAGSGLPIAIAQVADARSGAAILSESEIESIVQRVIHRISDQIVREVAWEVVPDMAEILIKEQLKTQQHGR
jgi:hypothetical protein